MLVCRAATQWSPFDSMVSDLQARPKSTLIQAAQQKAALGSCFFMLSRMSQLKSCDHTSSSWPLGGIVLYMSPPESRVNKIKKNTSLDGCQIPGSKAMGLCKKALPKKSQKRCASCYLIYLQGYQVLLNDPFDE